MRDFDCIGKGFYNSFLSIELYVILGLIIYILEERIMLDDGFMFEILLNVWEEGLVLGEVR